MADALEKLAIAHAALKRIAAYTPPDKLNRTADRDYGLPPEEAMEMAYDNVLIEARLALKAIGRLPRTARPTPTQEPNDAG